VGNSIFLAKLIGPFALALGIGVLVNRANMRTVLDEFIRSRALMFLAGVITLPAGLAIVLTMYDARNNLSGQVVADVRSFMGEKVYQTMIPRNVRVSEAPSYGKPVLLYDLKCVGSQAYLRLASEIIQRERTLRAA